MNQISPERLYHLLPEIYRWRDQQRGQKSGSADGGPLHAFLAILEEELRTLEIDMEAMYDNWFIQTCDNWVVPYIADLLGIHDDIVQIEYLPFTQRRRVANTLAYRRRKGVVAILEQVLWDVTNWHIRAVEFYQLLATAQHNGHLRTDQITTVDVRNFGTLAALGTPFTTVPRTVELRKIKPITPGESAKQTEGQAGGAEHSGQQLLSGTYQRNNVGLFFWRLRSYPVDRGHARLIDDTYFTFHPMGRDRQLFNRPLSFQALTQQAEAVNMPIKLTRAILAADLQEYAESYHKFDLPLRPPNSTYYGPDRSLQITILPQQLFELPGTLRDKLDADWNEPIDIQLVEAFAAHGVVLSSMATVQTVVKDKQWIIRDDKTRISYAVDRYLVHTDSTESDSTASDSADQAGANSNNDYLQVTREERPILPSEVVSVNLSALSTANADAVLEHWSHYAVSRAQMLVAVDPQLGRFALLNWPKPAAQANTSSADQQKPPFTDQELRVDYTYGSGGDIGGGPYPRRFQVDATWSQYCEIRVAVGCKNSSFTQIHPEGCVLTAASLPYAFALWHTYCVKALDSGTKPRGIIRVLDNGIYPLGVTPEGGPEQPAGEPATHRPQTAPLWLPPTAELALVAEDGVHPTIGGQGEQFYITFDQPVDDGMAVGRVQAAVQALATVESREGGVASAAIPVADRTLQLNGIGIQGSLTIAGIQAEASTQMLNAVDLIVEHCTILDGGVDVRLKESQAQALSLQIRWSIVGPLHIPSTVAALTVADSIIDYRLMAAVPKAAAPRPIPSGSNNHTGYAIAAPLTYNEVADNEVVHNKVTHDGTSAVEPGPPATLERCTIYGNVWLTHSLQADTVLFTDPVIVTVPAQVAPSGYMRFCYIPAGSQTPPCERCLHETGETAQCQRCLPNIGRPRFTAQHYDQPGYSQLSNHCATAIKEGMGGIAEIGVFSHLYQPQREANIRRMLDEYLPLGLHAGIFYVS